MTNPRSSFLFKWLLFSTAIIALTGAFFGSISPVNAIDLPTDFIETPYISNVPNPTAMRFAPDGRLFITQQTGELRVVENDILVGTPVLDLTVDFSGERGLLGLAFDPNFAVDNYIYLYYTVPGPIEPPAPPHNRVSRFEITGNVADPNSEDILLELSNLSSSNVHNGGSINFGADGMLYIATGDNGSGGNSQNMANLHGKILRIEKDGTIPEDNPFYDTATGDNRSIWALGLRNPYTAAFQPGTSLFYINDVGSSGIDATEEINEGSSAANFGWDIVEGEAGNPLYDDPVYAYT
ncbi:MAG: PQQ-dependent sugar dehydrogenase, partial [Anaerolineae bacterium]|nr:PQQ-dependent sugar dehydrogenase [Anaerolineae bacterium]